MMFYFYVLLTILGCFWIVHALPRPVVTVEEGSCMRECSCDSLIISCEEISHKTWLHFLNQIPQNVQRIYIRHSNFTELSLPKDAVMKSSVQVSHLYLTHSHVHHVGPKAFRSLPNLEELHLVQDAIEDLDVGAFASLPSLKLLNLSGNVISELHRDNFQSNKNLKILDLAHNHLEILYPRLFQHTPSLESVNLTKNRVYYVHPETFDNLTRIHTIDLNSNHLEVLHEDTFHNLTSLDTLTVHDNPWSCDCGLKWLHVRTNTTHPLLRKISPNIQCHSPQHFHKKTLSDIPLEKLSCEKPRIMNELHDVALKRHDTLVLQCNTSGYPPPSVYWITPRGVLALPENRKWMSPDIVHFKEVHSFAGMPTYMPSHLYALNDGALMIHQIRHYFTGQYICVAENPAGISMTSFNVTLVSQLVPDIHFSMLVGASTAMSFFLLAVIYALIRQAIFWKLKKNYKKKLALRTDEEDVDDDIEVIEELSPDSDYSSWYPSYWAREYVSPYDSPMKCTTPVEADMGNYNNHKANIRETLEDVRHRLRQGMERSYTKIRSRAQHVSESSRLYMSNLREHSSQYMQTIRESGSHTIQNIRSSGSNYANRVRAGMVLGVEQVKYHVQSMRELCLTGNLGQTISTVSVATNVDSQETYDVVKKITYV